MTRRRRLAAAAALSTAAALGAIATWQSAASPQRGAAPPAPPSGEVMAPAAAPRRDRRAVPTLAPSRPAVLPAPAPALPASAFEPMIHIPAGPPPEQGAGDDLEESGLPRRLFEAIVALEELAPTRARLAAAEARLGREIPAETRETLAAAFQERHDEAAAAIGDFGLQAMAEEDARRAIARAHEAYRDEAAAALGIPRAALERVLGPPSARHGR